MRIGEAYFYTMEFGERDKAEGLRWLRMAADQNNIEAQNPNSISKFGKIGIKDVFLLLLEMPLDNIILKFISI